MCPKTRDPATIVMQTWDELKLTTFPFSTWKTNFAGAKYVSQDKVNLPLQFSRITFENKLIYIISILSHHKYEKCNKNFKYLGQMKEMSWKNENGTSNICWNSHPYGIYHNITEHLPRCPSAGKWCSIFYAWTITNWICCCRASDGEFHPQR